MTGTLMVIRFASVEELLSLSFPDSFETAGEEDREAAPGMEERIPSQMPSAALMILETLQSFSYSAGLGTKPVSTSAAGAQVIRVTR